MFAYGVVIYPTEGHHVGGCNENAFCNATLVFMQSSTGNMMYCETVWCRGPLTVNNLVLPAFSISIIVNILNTFTTTHNWVRIGNFPNCQRTLCLMDRRMIGSQWNHYFICCFKLTFWNFLRPTHLPLSQLYDVFPLIYVLLMDTLYLCSITPWLFWRSLSEPNNGASFSLSESHFLSR